MRISKTRQPTEQITTNFLRLSDIVGYKNIAQNLKSKARKRASKVVSLMRLGYVETSILPPYLIRELWMSKVSREDRDTVDLIVEEAFDGGSVFYIIKKS